MKLWFKKEERENVEKKNKNIIPKSNYLNGWNIDSIISNLWTSIYCTIKFKQCKNNFFYVLSFLPDKKSTYKFLVRELQSLAGDLKMNWNPVTSMSDFQGSLVEVISSEVSVILLSCFNFNKHFNFFT
jgi:hypothetical protein